MVAGPPAHRHAGLRAVRDGDLTQDDPAVGPYVQDLVMSLLEKYGPTGYGSSEPWPRGFLVFNPYARRKYLVF